MPIKLEELRQLLDDLAQEGHATSYARLRSLSDLSGEGLVYFRATWPRFPAGLRQSLVRRLVELAESTFEVTFDSIFRACLSDPDDGVRALAIEGLWEDESTHLIGPFLSMLRSDPSILVRAAAAKALGRFVLAGELETLEAAIQDRIVSDLLTVLHLAGEDMEVRCRALESVAYVCRPEILDALELAYYDEDEAMRISAVVGMGRSCDRKWQPIVLQELESLSAPMRYEAVLTAGELSLRSAVPILGTLLDDPDPQMNQAAIWSLGQIGGSAAKQLLVDAYRGADEDTRAALDDALAEQALAEGDLDLVLYELEDDEPDAVPGAGLVTLWSADEDGADHEGDGVDPDEGPADDWDLDEPW